MGRITRNTYGMAGVPSSGSHPPVGISPHSYRFTVVEMSEITLPHGAVCQICASENTHVVRSEDQRRRRECKKCGHRWTTLELHLADYNRLLEVAETAKKLSDLTSQWG